MSHNVRDWIESSRAARGATTMSVPNSYAEVTVVVDGAVEETETFYDETLMADYIAQIGEEAESDGYPTEVYVQFHEHEPPADNEECACYQYEQSHKPYAEWNTQ